MGKIPKRILMLTHPEMDHLAYMIYDGLYKVLGKDNIDIYPFVYHYMGQKNLDNWYTLDDGKQGFTASPGYVSLHETPNISIDSVILNTRAGKYDIILFNNRTYSTRTLDALINIIGRNNLPPLVFFEGEDYTQLDTLRRMKTKYNSVANLKREYIQANIDEATKRGEDIHPIYPMPFSAIIENTVPDNPNKDIDIFALFGNTYPIRENIVKLINSSYLREKYNIYIGIDHYSSPCNIYNSPPKLYKDYQDALSRSKINIVARGWGFDSLRRFEAMCYSGLVLTDRLPITTPADFIDNQHLIYYNNDLSDLIPKIEYYLNNPNERERIGKAGKEYCLKYHTTDARVMQTLTRIAGHLN